MAMKQIAQRLQPLPLYFILGLTVCLFFLELVVAHITHSLTLLLDAYHALCNIIVLVGSIISTNHGSGRSERVSNNSTSHISNEELKSLSSLPQHTQMCCASRPGPERRLRNTFGWARVDVIVMLIGCVFLASLCFSVLVEALQTLVHISHHDEMHGPLFCLAIGVLAMVLNLLAYLLIGGYTFHQGSFLNTMTEAGVVVEAGNCQNDSQKQAIVPPNPSNAKRQGLWGLCRDCIGCVVVIVCSTVVYFTESGVAKYVDPAFSILSAILVLLLSYPFMKESCLILLQTIPDHINIGSLCNQLLAAFPDVVNVHELHVWRLTVDKTYCTAHIIFLNPKEYARITDDISRFFLGQGITHVTIQPEFYKDINKKELVSSTFSDCLVSCTEDMCLERHCCASRSPSLESVHVDHGHGHSHTHAHRRKGTSKVKSTNSGKPCSHADTILEVASSCVSQLSEVHTAASATTPVAKDTTVTETLVTHETKTGTTDIDRGDKDVMDLRIQFLSGGVVQDAVRRETTDV